MRKHLLLSSSRTHGTGYLEHAAEHVQWLLGPGSKRVAFVPFAAVRFSYDAYEEMVAGGTPGHEIVGVHRFDDPRDALTDADAILVGGGNTFKLVHDLHATGLMSAIREKVAAGTPFMGWSAGANVSSPRLCTTNDMPIIEPASFQTLGLISTQINPHYMDAHPDKHMGETRAERIEEFVTLSPQVPVIGLREGSMLKVDGDTMTLEGVANARLFTAGKPDQEIQPGMDVSFLL